MADYLKIAPGSAQKVLMHAVLGGALSSAKGGDFKTGALAGAASEGLTALATEKLDKYLDSRFTTDTQFRVGTAQLVGVLAGALVNGDPATASWVAGNAKKYNDEFHIGGPAIAGAVSAGEKVLKEGGTPDQATAAMSSHLRGDGFDGPMPANGLVQAWSIGVGLPLAAVEAPAVGIGGLVAGALISGGANFTYQLSTGKPVAYTDVSLAAGVGALTQGKGFWLTQGYGLSGAYLGSVIKGEDSKFSLLGTAIGTAIGYKTGNVVSGQLKPLVGGAASEGVGATMGSAMSEVIGGGVTNLGGGK
ncbi:hypothetical protein [Pseudomonas sp. MWU15-20650]|uniref:hypothetical protein n=1 Tax=Pseudomonas sp. MWU15-20650 TaxID=2933107 RepID=UPI0020100216|nr:hypothetical protein [Pseudomonas sp. MWU15-20650]